MKFIFHVSLKRSRVGASGQKPEDPSKQGIFWFFLSKQKLTVKSHEINLSNPSSRPSYPSDPSCWPSDPSDPYSCPSDHSCNPSDPSSNPSDPSSNPSDPSSWPSYPSSWPSDPPKPSCWTSDPPNPLKSPIWLFQTPTQPFQTPTWPFQTPTWPFQTPTWLFQALSECYHLTSFEGAHICCSEMSILCICIGPLHQTPLNNPSTSPRHRPGSKAVHHYTQIYIHIHKQQPTANFISKELHFL